MKDDFQHLEDDMTHLGARMEEITSSSNSINSALEDRKKEISKLCGVHHLLKKVRQLSMDRLLKRMSLNYRLIKTAALQVVICSIYTEHTIHHHLSVSSVAQRG